MLPYHGGKGRSIFLYWVTLENQYIQGLVQLFLIHTDANDSVIYHLLFQCSELFAQILLLTSRYGDEHKLAGFSATLQAIISFVENGYWMNLWILIFFNDHPLNSYLSKVYSFEDCNKFIHYLLSRGDRVKLVRAGKHQVCSYFITYPSKNCCSSWSSNQSFVLWGLDRTIEPFLVLLM